MKAFAWLLTSALLVSGCNESKVNSAALQKELETTQDKLNTAKATAAQLQAELVAAQAKIRELEPLAKKARTLPVRITTRTVPASGSNVYHFVNLSDSVLPVKIKLNNTTTRRSQSFTPLLSPPAPAKPFEIGAGDGWLVAPGDVLELASEGYDVLTKNF